MYWQETLVAVVFAGALFYMGSRMYKSIKAKKNHGCANCGEIELNKK